MNYLPLRIALTHWGRVTHICVSKLTIIGSDNSLSPGRRQAIIWTNAGILLIRTLGTNFSEILSEIHSFSSKKIPLKMSSGKWRPFCLGLNVLRDEEYGICWGSSIRYSAYDGENAVLIIVSFLRLFMADGSPGRENYFDLTFRKQEIVVLINPWKAHKYSEISLGITLHWCHVVIMAARITGNSAVCSTVC